MRRTAMELMILTTSKGPTNILPAQVNIGELERAKGLQGIGCAERSKLEWHVWLSRHEPKQRIWPLPPRE